MKTAETWRPLLEGDLAQCALQSIDSIAVALAGPEGEAGHPSYANGDAGVALFFGYLAVERGEQRLADLADQRLSRAIDAVAQGTLGAGFFNGFSGIAWTSQHLEELLTGAVRPDRNEEIDHVLKSALRLAPWRFQYDLVYGLAGLGCYAVDHADRAVAADLLGLIVERLSELAEAEGERLTWTTRPELIQRETQRMRYPDGYRDLGIAHGVAGVVGLLARACAAGLGDDSALLLLRGAVAWLLSCRRADDGGSVFPDLEARRAESCRSAWCYGDPGVASVLLAAGRALGEAAWEREALAVALRDCGRPFADTQVVDPCFCHGAAGLGHLYNRLYQASGEETFAQAARGWFERALAMRRPGEGVAGYAAWWPEIEEWRSSPELLGGAAGIGLALLAATSPVLPGWDRPLLLPGLR